MPYPMYYIQRRYFCGKTGKYRVVSAFVSLMNQSNMMLDQRL
jgi:hypothetical protein